MSHDVRWSDEIRSSSAPSMYNSAANVKIADRATRSYYIENSLTLGYVRSAILAKGSSFSFLFLMIPICSAPSSHNIQGRHQQQRHEQEWRCFISYTPSVNVKYMKTNVYTHGHAVVPAASIIFRNKLDKLSAFSIVLFTFSTWGLYREKSSIRIYARILAES